MVDKLSTVVCVVGVRAFPIPILVSHGIPNFPQKSEVTPSLRATLQLLHALLVTSSSGETLARPWRREPRRSLEFSLSGGFWAIRERSSTFMKETSFVQTPPFWKPVLPAGLCIRLTEVPSTSPGHCHCADRGQVALNLKLPFTLQHSRNSMTK